MPSKQCKLRWLTSRPVYRSAVRIYRLHSVYSNWAQDKTSKRSWQINRHSNKLKQQGNNPVSLALVKDYKLQVLVLNTVSRPNNLANNLVNMVRVLVCKVFKQVCKLRVSWGNWVRLSTAKRWALISCSPSTERNNRLSSNKPMRWLIRIS